MTDERRRGGIRRDLNALVRGKDGELSGSKIGTYVAQYIAARLLLTLPALPTWDALAVLFLVLIAPEAYKQMMAMKWGGGAGFTTTSASESKTVTRTVDAPKGKSK
mgnify:CR=1 FL=1